MKTLNIPTTKGHIDVPAFFIDGVYGLAVTMTSFGEFEVTHTKSGHKIIGGYERFANALVEMLSIYLAMREAGINFDAEPEDFKLQIKDSLHQSQYLNGLTIIEYLRIMKPIMGYSGEFPWEGGDEGPHAEMEKLMRKLSEVNSVETA
ncbi:hypothetical protein [Vibrio aestuarianus]|uniref:Uncharacterized protein n=1 Tax=Vibrio aestuarianus TaxID=28171 RepID=A0ABD7YS35_9VIBR|nr:hypothetical protein [Vibrio aestuarianus]WGK87238.1 hypothetical protein PYE67_14030 [Vibrio aestuarianus]CAH8235371.1 hypothetical protein VAEU17_4400046 [Vibrio aestuarianus]